MAYYKTMGGVLLSVGTITALCITDSPTVTFVSVIGLATAHMAILCGILEWLDNR